MAGIAMDTGGDADSTGPLVGGVSNDGRTIDARGLLGTGALLAGLLATVPAGLLAIGLLATGLLLTGLLDAAAPGLPVDDGVAGDADRLPAVPVAGSFPADCGAEIGAAELDPGTLGSPMEPAASEPGDGGPDWLPQDPRTSSSAPISTNNPELHFSSTPRALLAALGRPEL